MGRMTQFSAKDRKVCAQFRRNKNNNITFMH